MNLEQTLEKIADALSQQAIPDRLWTMKDIATYLQRKSSAVHYIKSKPGFPKPILLGRDKERSDPLWIPDEIKEWVKKQR